MQHTLGTWDFGPLRDVLLWRGVLSPRPETEDLAAVGGELLLAGHRSPGSSPVQRLAEALCRASPFGQSAPWGSLISPCGALAAALAGTSSAQRGQASRRQRVGGARTTTAAGSGGFSGAGTTSEGAGSSAAPPAPLLDLGSGTGVVGLAALARARLGGMGSCSAVLLDVDRDSVRLAAANAARLGMGGAVAAVQGDAGGALDELLQPALGALGGRAATVVLANPPYLPAAAMSQIAPHVARGEARRCLAGGGADGLREPLRWLEALLRSERSVPTGALVGMELDASHPEALWRMSREASSSTIASPGGLWEGHAAPAPVGADAVCGERQSAGDRGAAVGGPPAKGGEVQRRWDERGLGGAAGCSPRRRLRWLTGQRDVLGRPRFVWLQVVEAP